MSPKNKAYLSLAMFITIAVSLLVGTQIYYKRKLAASDTATQTNQISQTTETPAATTTDIPAAETPEASPSPPAAAVVAVVSNFGAASARNADLMSNLEWAFGGRAQRGWYLYAPLIAREIGTDKKPDDEAFAVALAAWQVSAKLNPSGILDNDTWTRMIAAWQERRLKDHTPAAPNQLLTASTADFYDPSRPDGLRKVELQTYAAYKRMIQAAAVDSSLRLATSGNGNALASSEKFLKIVSAYRSREYQEGLRKASPNAGRAGLAVNSPHFTGHALDMYVGGDPVSTEDSNRLIQINTPVYQWLVKNADKFGFRPYFYEPWHWEYVGEPSADIQ